MKDRAKKILIFTLGGSILPKVTEILISFVIHIPYSIYGICGILYMLSYAVYPIIIKNINDLKTLEKFLYFLGIYFSITFVFIFILFPIILSL